MSTQYEIENNSINSLELPILFPPPIKSYLPYSIISSIILGNEKTHNWLYNNFIQLYMKSPDTLVETYPNQDFFYADQSLLKSTELTSLNYQLDSKKLIEDLIFWLDNSNYIVIYLPESNIPGTRFFNQKPFLHSQFIFGYDLKSRVFKLMNFSNKTNDIAIINVNFDDLLNAFNSNEHKALFETPHLDWRFKNKQFRIILLRYHNYNTFCYNCNIDIDSINFQLFNYFKSKNSSLGNVFFTCSQKGIWGISIYNEVLKRLDNAEAKNLDYRLFHLIFEHKTIMQSRFKELSKNFEVNDFTEDWNLMIKLSDKLRLLCMKYNITGNSNTRERMKELVTELYHTELKTLERYFTDIGYIN